eukprot:6483438-Amphidinium_carterae.1
MGKWRNGKGRSTGPLPAKLRIRLVGEHPEAAEGPGDRNHKDYMGRTSGNRTIFQVAFEAVALCGTAIRCTKNINISSSKKSKYV